MSSGFKEFVIPSGNISFSANQYQATKTITINGNGLIYLKYVSKDSISITKINIDNKGDFLTTLSAPLQIYFIESITITFYCNTSSAKTVALSEYYGYYLN